ncbi:MAG: cell division ATP-binding protein FtsE [Gemmatimonadetes bacterium]|nr:cell division ATP-binding protein FtsE [Gemmatimonadota bacterium]MBT8479862.1 cell division ATP-binding protein FtsE [Gemmatimonadota bacterium]
MVQFRSVTKSFGGSSPAVLDVSFHLRKGEFAFLTGASGAGKTTILKLVHMLHRPSSGEVRVSRYSSSRIKRRDLPDLRRRVGYIFQDFRLLENLTAEENIAFALQVTGTAKAKIAPRVRKLLNQVGLAARAQAFPRELSGGEQQRVAVARALANEPLVLLADEPTGNLDERASSGVFELFRRINASGTSVLMATHDAELLRRHRNVRVIELEQGRLVFDSAGDPVA